MNYSVPAIYENGVLRLLQPLPLRDQEVVSLVVERATMRELDVDEIQNQQAALKRMLDTTAALPLAAPADGFSNRDHDRLLYGDK